MKIPSYMRHESAIHRWTIATYLTLVAPSHAGCTRADSDGSDISALHNPAMTMPATTHVSQPSSLPTTRDGSEQSSPSRAASSIGDGCPIGMVKLLGGKLSARRRVPVIMPSLCVEQHEVTVKEYAECVFDGKCMLPKIDDACNWSHDDTDDHPVNCVNLDDGETYCKWRYNARLPTHDEWEWAAAGREAANIFPWGNDPPGDRVCWSGITKRNGTCPVNSHPAGNSPEGISDLAGNVDEWTSTIFSEGLGSYVVRGGAWWDTNSELLGTDVMNHEMRKSRLELIGFRCFKTINPREETK